MRKLLYILPVLLILGFAACENYVDITPTGKKTVDSTETYYELVALPNRSYYPSSFALLSRILSARNIFPLMESI